MQKSTIQLTSETLWHSLVASAHTINRNSPLMWKAHATLLSATESQLEALKSRNRDAVDPGKEEEPSGFQAHKRNNTKRLNYKTNIILSNKM